MPVHICAAILLKNFALIVFVIFCTQIAEKSSREDIKDEYTCAHDPRVDKQ